MQKEQHGGRYTRLYNIWLNMKQRCSNPKASHYEYYGGKGVSVCEEWKKSFSTFRDWALSNGYEDGLTIDRIESDKDYCPENCRWVTHLQQMSNTTRNVMLTYQGETHSLSEWSRIVGVPYGTLKSRLRYGWSVERMLGGVTS